MFGPHAAGSIIVHTIQAGRFLFDCTVSLTAVCGQQKESAVMVFILSKIKCFFRLLQSAALQFISITHKKSTSFDYSGGFFVIWIKFPIISSVISVYFSFISLMIRLRFTANIAIAPCISMLMRPDDDAV